MRMVGLVVCIASIWFSPGTALAQSAPTCSFNIDTGALDVAVNGAPATLSAVGGPIRLNSVQCGSANVNNTDTIQIDGAGLDDAVTLNGTFGPGRTAEADANSEIEISFALGDGSDLVKINYTGAAEWVQFRSTGIDNGNDGDEDVYTAGIETQRIYGKGGNDTLNAPLYIGGGTLYLYGGDGNDVLYGSEETDWLYGEVGDDDIRGAGGNDKLYGGVGSDNYSGGDGNDVLWEDASADPDFFSGGNGIDTVNYSMRTIGVTVTIGSEGMDDGAPGELDRVEGDIENVMGGAGNDVLIGDSKPNKLTGNAGDDELHGEGGGDLLYGNDGQDVLVGDNGNDKLYGGNGADDLDGGTGTDQFFGQAGNDTFGNNDGVAETVDCGTGPADDAETDALDTLISCEL